MGVTSVQQRGDSVSIECSDSDSVLRHLITRTPAHDFEVTSRNLEDAFIALTTDSPQEAVR